MKNCPNIKKCHYFAFYGKTKHKKNKKFDELGQFTSIYVLQKMSWFEIDCYCYNFQKKTVANY